MRSGAVHDVVVSAGEIAAVDAFHLDHPRAEVREVAGGQRRRNGLLDGDYGESLQRQAHFDFLLGLADQSAADDEPLDFAGALVEAHQADVAVDALDGNLTHVTGSAVYLDREIGGLAGHLGAIQFGRRRSDAPILSGDIQPCCLTCQRPAGHHTGLLVGDHRLN